MTNDSDYSLWEQLNEIVDNERKCCSYFVVSADSKKARVHFSAVACAYSNRSN